MLQANPIRRRRVLAWVAGGTAAAVLLILAVAGGYVYSLAHTFDDSRHVAAPAFPRVRPPAVTGRAAEAVNILLLGIDANSTEARREHLPSNKAADMVAVVHIPASRDRVYLMSILRTSAVSLPVGGLQPISGAYARGGIPLEVQAVESLLRVRMDHVMAISIPGLRGATDALGGVTVSNPSAFTSHGYSFPAGKQKLNGRQAVAFVRGAPGAASADQVRAQAQEAFIRGALGDLLSAKTVLNPAATSAVVSVLSPYLTVDGGLNSGYVGQLGFELRNVRPADITVFRLPTGAPRSAGSVAMLEPDPSRLSVLQQHFRSDTLDQYLR